MEHHICQKCAANEAEEDCHVNQHALHMEHCMHLCMPDTIVLHVLVRACSLNVCKKGFPPFTFSACVGVWCSIGHIIEAGDEGMNIFMNHMCLSACSYGRKVQISVGILMNITCGPVCGPISSVLHRW